MRELAPSEAQEALVVKAAIDLMFDCQKAADTHALVGLLIHLADSSCLSGEGVRAGVASVTAGLEDLALDVPMSPQVLGWLVGAALAAGVLAVGCLEGLLEAVESTDPKRHFIKYGWAGKGSRRGVHLNQFGRLGSTPTTLAPQPLTQSFSGTP